jgi:hypothetical protein
LGGSKNAGLLAVRELDEMMGLTDIAGDFICSIRITMDLYGHLLP